MPKPLQLYLKKKLICSSFVWFVCFVDFNETVIIKFRDDFKFLLVCIKMSPTNFVYDGTCRICLKRQCENRVKFDADSEWSKLFYFCTDISVSNIIVPFN